MIPVYKDSYTDLQLMIPGAIDLTRWLSDDTILPFLSIGVPNGLPTQPNFYRASTSFAKYSSLKSSRSFEFSIS